MFLEILVNFLSVFRDSSFYINLSPSSDSRLGSFEDGSNLSTYLNKGVKKNGKKNLKKILNEWNDQQKFNLKCKQRPKKKEKTLNNSQVVR